MKQEWDDREVITIAGGIPLPEFHFLRGGGGAKINSNNIAYRGVWGSSPEKNCSIDPLRLILTQSESQMHTHRIST